MTMRYYRLLAFICAGGVTIPRAGEGWRTLMQVRAECPGHCRYVIHLRDGKFVLLDMHATTVKPFPDDPDRSIWEVKSNAEREFDTFDAAIAAGIIQHANFDLS